jgi:hypothetical protein
MAKDIQSFLKHNLWLRELWYFFSAAIIAGVILEMIWPHLVLVYFNLNILFILWFSSGIFLLFKK